ncbi:MAG: peptidoglycan-associated lipoprotein Pal [Acidobacteriota bacterium]|jgi:peptidoglycan-associated lipoprotein
MKRVTLLPLLLVLLVVASACGKKDPVAVAPPPVGTPAPFPGASASADPSPTRPPDPPPIPLDPDVSSAPLGAWDTMSIDEINSSPDSPLKPVFFGYDSDELDEEAQRVLAANAEVLRRYPTWVVTIEGHCDERGTPEYNLALGDRRAMAARTYLISLGISPQRLRTVSYGKEFPFDPGHNEAAWAKNRRAHFMLTAK